MSPLKAPYNKLLSDNVDVLCEKASQTCRSDDLSTALSDDLSAALSSSFQAELQSHAEKMLLLLKQEQLASLTMEKDKHESDDDVLKKREQPAVHDCKHNDVQSNMRQLTAELDSMDRAIGAELERGVQMQVMARLDSITKDIDAGLDHLRQLVQNITKVTREAASKSDTDEVLRSIDHLPLVAQPECNQRVSSGKDISVLRLSAARCCAAPPRPLVRGILS
mmetsp:Transcript_62240/g.117623  ORF Transcript_62240/g.117623 Transcript_62240/m.117623 type:complete len:222 (+) Transcript_62240:2-667(+)